MKYYCDVVSGYLQVTCPFYQPQNREIKIGSSTCTSSECGYCLGSGEDGNGERYVICKKINQMLREEKLKRILK